MKKGTRFEQVVMEEGKMDMEVVGNASACMWTAISQWAVGNAGAAYIERPI